MVRKKKIIEWKWSAESEEERYWS